ncbi:MAG: SufS family cysteine desulfurase [Candidatus Micrarchaeota archaeon]
MLDIEKIRSDFPILSRPGRFIYLDSAATSQKPRQVIDAVVDFWKNGNANVARGLYPIAEEATLAYEGVRKKAGSFINAKSENEIIFTKNTTEAVNLAMRGLAPRIKKGDRIVTTLMEHHSDFVPWQQLAKMKGARFEAAGLADDGQIDWADLEKKMKGAKISAFSAASNVLGTLNDTKAVCALARENGAISVVDGAQSVPSLPTDVKKMGCDLLSFSGHKMLAPFGVGILYGREELLEKMEPLLYGSQMIRSVTIKKTEWNDVPYRFEAGTPIVDAVIGFGAALDYLNALGMENVRKHEESLTGYMLDKLDSVEGLSILGPMDEKKRVGLAAFAMDGIHPHDVSAMLAEDGICVRSGHHCAMPLHDRLGIPASTRASVYIYNKKEEIDALAESLKKIRRTFG